MTFINFVELIQSNLDSVRDPWQSFVMVLRSALTSSPCIDRVLSKSSTRFRPTGASRPQIDSVARRLNDLISRPDKLASTCRGA